MDITDLRRALLSGLVIPAHPLALTSARRLDERAQRALTRYYVAAGAGGIAVAVHTTEFEIRDPAHALLRPVLDLASRTVTESLVRAPRPFIRIAGAIGSTRNAVAETELARTLGYDAVLLSLGAFAGASDTTLLAHCRAVAEVLPLVGFYLQPAVGGRWLSYAFWRAFSEIPEVVAIKIAPFSRYATLDVVRAVSDTGRDDVALYTGNDDSIIVDLLTLFPVAAGARPRRIVGGLLGHWALWTRRAVELLERVRRGQGDAGAWLREAAAVTDMNAAVFDSAHAFTGCVPGILEVLRRQGLVRGTWCLNPAWTLSAGQSEEITRVTQRYPELTDDEFVAEHRDAWAQ
ncbi:MAG: dihydrodipicolinate synthase family protein [Gemmatimonadaceae bacterium]